MDTEWRHPFSRDYARVVHSPALRRLQGKTQVFPVYESDFFRNRLTHSLEVSQVAEGIAERLNTTDAVMKRLPADQQISTKLCRTASLAHDLGHPPFGHNGENALDACMRFHGGFEGNAQSLRIVGCLEKKAFDGGGIRLGLDLCYRTLAAILKYDTEIPPTRRPEEARPIKGYYASEAGLVGRIKVAVVGAAIEGFKTLECSIMDVADDIAYSTYDLEDCLKARFLTPAGILTSGDRLSTKVAKAVSKRIGREISADRVVEVFRDIFEGTPRQPLLSVDGIPEFSRRYRVYEQISDNGYFRTKLSSELVGRAVASCTLRFNHDNPALSVVALSDEAQERVEILKHYTFAAAIYSSRVKVPEFRGYEVVKGIFEALAGPRGEVLMPDDVRDTYEDARGDLNRQMRCVSDYVAGMTDRYAMEFYSRLHSDSPQSMFKPL